MGYSAPALNVMVPQRVTTPCAPPLLTSALYVVKPDVAVAPNHKWLASSEAVQKLYEPPTLARKVPNHCQL